MYDSSTGTFIEEDPTEFGGGDTNLYRYCGDSPTNYVDPSGLFETPLDGFQSSSGQAGGVPHPEWTTPFSVMPAPPQPQLNQAELWALLSTIPNANQLKADALKVSPNGISVAIAEGVQAKYNGRTAVSFPQTGQILLDSSLRKDNQVLQLLFELANITNKAAFAANEAAAKNKTIDKKTFFTRALSIELSKTPKVAAIYGKFLARGDCSQPLSDDTAKFLKEIADGGGVEAFAAAQVEAYLAGKPTLFKGNINIYNGTFKALTGQK